MPSPTFLGDGSTPRRTDAQWVILQKILGSMTDGGGSGSGGVGLSGTGSPQGVVTANPGAVYTDTSTGAFWNKVSGTGNTGWQNLIA